MVEGNALRTGLGSSVAGAGDVDGDGFLELILGAPEYNTGRGRLLLFRGSSSGPGAAPAWSIDNPLDYGELGRSVASAGDVDGDGYADVLVGAPLLLLRGAALVYRGSPAGLPTTPDWYFFGETDMGFGGEGFGHAVASAGDVNGDG